MESKMRLDGWAATLSAISEAGGDALDEPLDWANALSEALTAYDAHGPVTRASQDEVETTFTVFAPDVLSATGQATNMWSSALDKVGGPSLRIVRLDVATYDELEKDYRRSALPSLVGVSEVAEILEVSPQRVSALKKDERFPRPLAYLASGPVWAEAAIRRFLDTWERRAGPRRVGRVPAPY